MIEFFLILCLVIIFIFGIVKRLKEYRDEKTKEKIQELARNVKDFSPKDFFEFKKNTSDFSGVYILHNINKDVYYVGQATKILYRVNRHFTGQGNGDVFSDYKYGDEFSIKLISLGTSGFDTLNKLEKAAIMTYDSYNKGYNKTRGNIDGGASSMFGRFYYDSAKNKSKYNKNEILELLGECAKGNLEEEFEVYKEIRKGLFGFDVEYPGIYIIHNKTKKLYYISKSNHIFNSINQHFTGSGNNTIYADFMHGDNITIKTISAGYNKYSTLDELVVETKKEYEKIANDYLKKK